jgi:hypothetical protein
MVDGFQWDRVEWWTDREDNFTRLILYYLLLGPHIS